MTEATAPSPTSGPTPAPTPADERRSAWALLGLSLAAAIVVLLGLRFGVGVDLDGPTLALAVACIVLIWALRGLWGIVVALSRPAVDSWLIESESGADVSNLAELREDKRRILRAIKELEFDHAMGKLSDQDFREVGDRYRLRAIEVLRALDQGGDLHPQLAEHLAALGLQPSDSAARGPAGEEAEA